MTPIPWVPVRNHGCGWIDCPQCGPGVEAEIEREHQRRVASTYGSQLTEADQVNAWLGEAYGTGGVRARPKAKRPSKDAPESQPARVDPKEEVRVQRTLSAEEKGWALAELKAEPLRKAYLRRSASGRLTRTEWRAEVWLEFVNPTVLVGRREREMTLPMKLNRAISRAQGRMARAASMESKERHMAVAA